MRALITALALFAAAGCATPQSAPPVGYHLVPGSFIANRGPDGNSIFLDTRDGLILIDTGRHPAHRDKLLAYAQERGRPIVAVFNTHWHLDHNSGNAAIRAAYPQAEVYATNAIEGALVGFFPQSRSGAEQFLASGQASAEQTAEIERDFDTMDHPERLRPTRPVLDSGQMAIDGRRLQINVARFAATEADLWIYDQRARLAIVGDLVVDAVPFMDTACPESWRRALGEVAATSFETLIPGHGAPMNRVQFDSWRTAFNNLLDCGASGRSRQDCVDGWLNDAAEFIPAGDERRIGGAVGYYLDTRLRASPEEKVHYCRPLTGA